MTDKGLGAFPSNNEWDKYIVKSNLGGKIIAGDNNVWNLGTLATRTWCQDTLINGFTAYEGSLVTNSGYRTSRFSDTNKYITFNNYNYSGNDVGFRPVIQFIESNSKANNLFY